MPAQVKRCICNSAVSCERTCSAGRWDCWQESISRHTAGSRRQAWTGGPQLDSAIKIADERIMCGMSISVSPRRAAEAGAAPAQRLRQLVCKEEGKK